SDDAWRPHFHSAKLTNVLGARQRMRPVRDRTISRPPSYPKAAATMCNSQVTPANFRSGNGNWASLGTVAVPLQLFVFLEHHIGGVLGVEILRSIGLRNTRAHHANGEFVTTR